MGRENGSYHSLETYRKVGGINMNNKVKEALGSASYLTYHWSQYSFEQLEKEMVRVCGLCHKALDIPQDDSVTDFERGQWSVIQNVIGYINDSIHEGMRVLKTNGTLIFKWNEQQINVSDVLKAITDYKPIFGHRTTIKNQTIWMAFIK